MSAPATAPNSCAAWVKVGPDAALRAPGTQRPPPCEQAQQHGHLGALHADAAGCCTWGALSCVRCLEARCEVHRETV
eukprot:365164-Chlamydomonas_euryale.AAC.9